MPWVLWRTCRRRARCRSSGRISSCPLVPPGPGWRRVAVPASAFTFCAQWRQGRGPGPAGPRPGHCGWSQYGRRLEEAAFGFAFGFTSDCWTVGPPYDYFYGWRKGLDPTSGSGGAQAVRSAFASVLFRLNGTDSTSSLTGYSCVLMLLNRVNRYVFVVSWRSVKTSCTSILNVK